ncbi:hypothetical protein BDW74DRAFT_161484 [Aspergillus multicolor]|uniref:uncharacterized protein n=1 Tax=Aspergillus multicolor TaxID=41759 RepID=UPI003CCD057D
MTDPAASRDPYGRLTFSQQFSAAVTRLLVARHQTFLSGHPLLSRPLPQALSLTSALIFAIIDQWAISFFPVRATGLPIPQSRLPSRHPMILDCTSAMPSRIFRLLLYLFRPHLFPS